MASAPTEAYGFVRPSKDGVLVTLRVSPGAKKTSAKGPYGESAVKLAVAAPPVDGKANTEAERYLAKLLDVATSEISIVHGASSRDKTVLVRGRREEEVLERLKTLL